jgi:hypothetical protein
VSIDFLPGQGVERSESSVTFWGQLNLSNDCAITLSECGRVHLSTADDEYLGLI